ncbi:MAG: hypothetical protein ACKVI4_17005, partial [Actinomycetales bacterium]
GVEQMHVDVRETKLNEHGVPVLVYVRRETEQRLHETTAPALPAPAGARSALANYKRTLASVFEEEAGEAALAKFKVALLDGMEEGGMSEQSAREAVNRFVRGLWVAVQAAELVGEPWAAPLKAAMDAASAVDMAKAAVSLIRDGPQPLKHWLETTVQPSEDKPYANPPTGSNPGSAMDWAGGMRKWLEILPQTVSGV